MAQPLAGPRVTLNGPCPCGSKKKFKRCCGAAPRRPRAVVADTVAGDINDKFQQALMLQRQGLAAGADRLYGEILDEDPQHAGALHMRGVVTLQQARPEEAIGYLRRSVAAQPDRAAAHSDLGNALQVLGHMDEALASYQRAITLQPESFEAHFNQGVAHQRKGQLEEALRCYDKTLQLRPAWTVALLRRALLLTQMQRLAEACTDYERCLAADPANIDAMKHRAQVLHRLGRLEEAAQSAAAVLQVQPENPDALLVRAQVLADQGNHTAAARALVSWLRSAPGIDFAPGQRLYLQSTLCDWSDYEETARALRVSVEAGERAATPEHFALVSDSPVAQLICARTFISRHDQQIAAPTWQGGPYGHGKIRVAYVGNQLDSPELQQGLLRVLEHRDRSRFDTIGISLQPLQDSSDLQRLRGAFDELLDHGFASAADAASWVRSREVDVLVDLSGFTSATDLNICAHRAAPVQVNYLGLPGTSGAAYMDYILADEFVIPTDARAQYTEQVVWLPGCHRSLNLAGDSVAGSGPARRDLGLADEAVVFCCFNSNHTFNPTSFDVWMRVLRAVPAGQLWLLADNEVVEVNLRARARSLGLDPARLVFAARVPHAQHLARLQRADLFLDTFPCSAGDAAAESLAVGLPVLSWPGEAFSARTAASQLQALDMLELIGGSLPEYEARAIELATQPDKMAAIRTRLLRLRNSAALFDTESHCRHLEWAYARMVERLRNGQQPEPFTVPSQPRSRSRAS